MKTLSVGTFEENCSIHRGYIVDPGAEAERIIAALGQEAPKAILLTHAHFDHIGAVGRLQARFPDLEVFVHPEDAKIITHPLNNFPPDYPPAPMPQNITWHAGESPLQPERSAGHVQRSEHQMQPAGPD